MADDSDSRGRPPGGPGAITIDAAIPADPTQLQLLRSIAAALAVSLDFDIDTMADMRMAVDELGTTVVTRARPESQVECRFVSDGDVVTVTATAAVASAQDVDTRSFGWMVLTTLAQSVRSEVADLDGSGPRLTVSLTVRPSRAGQ